MSSLGSLDEATQLVKLKESTLKRKGWKRFDKNCSREVWLSPSKVIYKREEDTSDQQNEMELEAARSLKRRGFRKYYIPKTTSYEVNGETIIAMEYIPGQTVTKHHGLDKIIGWTRRERKEREIYNRDELERYLGVHDLHSDNLIQMANGKIAIVDFGFTPKNFY